MSDDETKEQEHDPITLLLAERQIKAIAEQVFDELDDIKRKLRSQNARISNLKRQMREEGEEDEEEREEIIPQTPSLDLSQLPPGFQLDRRKRGR